MTILPELERDLYAAAQRHLPARRSIRGGGLRTTAAGLSVTFALAVAVAIAAVAVVALGHRSHPSRPRPTAAPPAQASARAGLIRDFGILRAPARNLNLSPLLTSAYYRAPASAYHPAPARRPGPNPARPGRNGVPPGPNAGHPGPNAARPGRGAHPKPNPARPPAAQGRFFLRFQAPRSWLRRWGYPALDRRLIRAVPLPAWKATVFVLPTGFQPSSGSGERSEGLNLFVSSGRAAVGTGPRPATAGSVLAHGLSLTVPLTRAMTRVAVLVPNGVARIALARFRPVSSAVRAPWFAGGAPWVPARVDAALAGLTAAAQVRHNLAALEILAPTVTMPAGSSTSGGQLVGFRFAATADETWLDAAGHVVRRTTTAIDLRVRFSTSPR